MHYQKLFFIVIYSIIFCSTFGLSILLYYEFQYFQKESEDLAQVKESYYQHVDMLKRSLNASMSQDDADMSLGVNSSNESLSDDQKKKIIKSNYLITSTESQDSEKDADLFQMISKDEESKLHQLKQYLQGYVTRTQTIKQPLVKKNRSKSLAQRQLKRIQRWVPSRDIQLIWPIELKNFWLSSLFGPRKRPGGKIEFHHAIDMAALKGTPVKAAAAGKVLIAGHLSGYGYCILLEHNNRFKTRYAHLHRIHVAPGQTVQQGQMIGAVGDSGLVRKSGHDASHLHFEVYQDGTRVNPLGFLFS